MFQWYKKEIPLLSIFGLGGGIGSKLIGGTLKGLTATGGVINEYTVGSTIYRAHIFTSSGTFNVSAIGNYGSNVEYLVVAGGGAGGGTGQAGGGGAGGFRTNLSGHPLAGSAFPVSTSPGSYTVTVGGGGAPSPSVPGRKGNDSVFGSITSTGGGGGGAFTDGPATNNGGDGGSGGGSGNNPGNDVGGSGNTPPTSPSQGNPGGSAPGYSSGFSVRCRLSNAFDLVILLDL